MGQEKSRPRGKTQTYKYNEKPASPPGHRYPRGAKVELRRFPGAGVRIMVEQFAQGLAGVHPDALKKLGFTPVDMATHRETIRRAMLAVLREGPAANSGRQRGSAIAYLGELRLSECVEVLAGIGTSPVESSSIRGLAAESLCRIGGADAVEALRAMICDPEPVVRTRSVKALGIIAGEHQGRELAALAASDPDPEVRFQAGLAARKILPKDARAELPPLKKRPKRRKARYSLKEENIVRSFGRHVGLMPQTDHRHDHREDEKRGLAGDVDHVATRMVEPFEPGMRLAAPGYALERAGGGEWLRIVDSEPASASPLSPPRPTSLRTGCETFTAENGDRILRLARSASLTPGRPLPFCFEGDGSGRSTPTFVPDVDAAPVITALEPDAPVLWSGRSFGLRIRFRSLGEQRPVWLKLEIRFPKATWQERWIAVTGTERETGACSVRGFRCAESGRIEIRATLYGESGGASRATAQLQALPANPHSVSVVPQTRGTNGEGPAHYNSSEDKYYCYATCTFTNGNASSITVGPTVTCTVTDGGNHLTTFSFSIGTWTVNAQSTRVLGIWTSFGSGNGVYGVFDDFGDVRMEFSFQSSNGSIADSSVWAAMAKVNLALNFVGNISSSTRATFQSVVETEASAIYEQQSLYISDTQRFVLPSSDPDWSRYRDIEMDDNKANDCTAGSDEADDLRDDWSSPTDWLDVWIVESFSGPSCASSVGGFSPKNGPTGKGGPKSGVLIQLAGIDLTAQWGRDLIGIIVAHEVGHFLNLDSGPGNHNSNASNFMAASTGGTNTDITHAQYLEMAKHGFVERFVP